MRGPNPVPMLKQLQMGLRAFLVLASKIWTFICFVFRKNTRAVRIHSQLDTPIWFFSCSLYLVTLKCFVLQVIQHQTVKYEVSPLSPLSKHRLSKASNNCTVFWYMLTDFSCHFFFFGPGMVRRKILVLDLDETLIHSHHDGVVRQTVKPGTPPDFVLKVTIDRHPVRFFVHKRPHVDFFLDVVTTTTTSNNSFMTNYSIQSFFFFQLLPARW